MEQIGERIQFHISVRTLVEFLLRSGDIEEGRGGMDSLSAMQKGAKLHRRIQNRMGSNYHAEVTLSHTVAFADYDITIDGRADGIIIEERADGEPAVTVDEIKGVYADVNAMEEPVAVHLAQAKCYAYIYALQNGLSEISVQMTYGSLEKDDIRRFQESYSFADIAMWFEALMGEYRRWSDFSYEWRGLRTEAIRKLAFPFAYRPGQKKLASDVYRTIQREKTLFIEAPCGTGKTISTVFPAVKAMGEGLGKTLFYLTAKTAARSVAVDTFALLHDGGLRFKTVEITAKDKICPLEERKCNPKDCPRAKGHFDRINDALYALLTEKELFTRPVIEAHAQETMVCPFELSLDLASFCDGVVGDYNYAFDPNVSLARFFGEGRSGDYLFLVDEAHNLVDRAREMYSARLVKEDFLRIKKYFKTYNGGIPAALDKCNRILLAWKRRCEDYLLLPEADELIVALLRVSNALDKFFEKRIEIEHLDEIREFYFEVRHFLNMSECLDEHYRIYCDFMDNGCFFVKLFCIDPSHQLAARLAMAKASVFFSATLLPVNYYKKLLCEEEKPYAVYAKSSFDSGRRLLVLGRDVTSLYRRRGPEEYERFAQYIRDIVSARSGNYMIYGPSFAFIHAVYEKLADGLPDDVELLLQKPEMDEAGREAFLERFDDGATGGTLIGFCVMGGIFSEGIDLTGERLIGAIILGAGLPMVTHERQIIRDHFDGAYGDGFLYAFLYPGMNKVLQAAGRVIRTAEDMGVVALLDERFLRSDYAQVFPREWTDIETVTEPQVRKTVEKFWMKIAGS